MKAPWVTSGRSSKSKNATLASTKKSHRQGGFFLISTTVFEEEAGGLSFLQKFLGDLRKFLADLAGQAVMNASRLDAGNVGHHHGRGCGYGNNQPDHAKEEK